MTRSLARLLLAAALACGSCGAPAAGVPDAAELKALLPAISPNFGDLAKRLPLAFDPAFKSPCWWDAEVGLLCLPFAYLAGFPKCGTTTLWSQLAISHRNLVRSSKMATKEPQWWTRNAAAEPFLGYAAAFRENRDKILLSPRANVYLDGSVQLAWEPMLHSVVEHKLLPPHVLASVQPAARALLLVREPTARLWSDFTYFEKRTEPDVFDARVGEQIEWLGRCFCGAAGAAPGARTAPSPSARPTSARSCARRAARPRRSTRGSTATRAPRARQPGGRRDPARARGGRARARAPRAPRARRPPRPAAARARARAAARACTTRSTCRRGRARPPEHLLALRRRVGARLPAARPTARPRPRRASRACSCSARRDLFERAPATLARVHAFLGLDAANATWVGS